MLIDFSFSNFRSFRDEQSFSMTRDERFTESNDSRQSPITAIYGANASGKSNFLKAICAMRSMVTNSYSQGDANSDILRERSEREPIRGTIDVLPGVHSREPSEIPVLVPL